MCRAEGIEQKQIWSRLAWNLHSNEGQCTTQKPANQYRARHAMNGYGVVLAQGLREEFNLFSIFRGSFPKRTTFSLKAEE